jgi:hypothetical protein
MLAEIEQKTILIKQRTNRWFCWQQATRSSNDGIRWSGNNRSVGTEGAEATAKKAEGDNNRKLNQPMEERNGRGPVSAEGG